MFQKINKKTPKIKILKIEMEKVIQRLKVLESSTELRNFQVFSHIKYKMYNSIQIINVIIFEILNQIENQNIIYNSILIQKKN